MMAHHIDFWALGIVGILVSAIVFALTWRRPT